MSWWDNLRAAWAETQLIYRDIRDCIRSLIHGAKGGWN